MEITVTNAVLRLSGSHTEYVMYTRDDVELFTVDAIDSYIRRVMRAIWYMRSDGEYVPCVILPVSDCILNVMYDGNTFVLNTNTNDVVRIIKLSDKVRSELNAS